MDAAILRAFLDDIKADPFDDTPRLILADWLEDHAGVAPVHDRGTLLRLQCEASLLSEYDPDRGRMREAARELIARHESLWLGPLNSVPTVSHDFVRGMLHLTLRGPDLASPALANIPPAAWQWVEGLTILAEYDNHRHFIGATWPSHLTRLEIWKNGLADWPEYLDASTLPHLADLRIEHAQAEDHCLVELARRPVMGRLRRFALRGNEIGPNGWRRFGEISLSRLEFLTLSHCSMNAPGLRNLALTALPALRELDLGHNCITGDGLASLRTASFSPGLERLNLSRNPLTSQGVRELVDAPLTALRHLDLARCGLTDPSVGMLATAGWLDRLESLDLRQANLTDCGPELLTAGWPALGALNLGDCGLTPDSLTALADSPYLASLRELDLRENHFGDAGVARLVRGSFPALRVLRLDGTHLTDASARHLAEWPGIADLWLLTLTGNGLTATGEGLLADSVFRSPSTKFVLWD